MESNPLSALYYPFSRCINERSLKQMLFVFDRVCFLDPIEDHEWRAFQFRQLEGAEDPRFEKYRSLFSPIEYLQSVGAVKRISPDELVLPKRGTVSAAAISDLLDPKWTLIASQPEHFGLPHRTLSTDKSATWNIFRSKMPDEYVEALRQESTLNHHLVKEGGNDTSWTVSYAAGSASALNIHLAAAEELCLAPVTDSMMHHLLLIRKATREAYGTEIQATRPIPVTSLPALANSLAISLIGELIPASVLDGITFEEITRFRDDTVELRQMFVKDLESRLSVVTRVPDPDDIVHAQKEIQARLRNELKEYAVKMTDAKAKIWPNLVSSLNTTLAGGGVAAVAFNHLGGAGCILAGSIAAASLAFLKSTLDVKCEVKKAKASASPSVNFLSTLKDEIRK
jgi:hypothetical protein